MMQDAEVAGYSPFPLEVCACIVAALVRLSQDPIADIATHAWLLLQVG
jgi:hypothetical protein